MSDEKKLVQRIEGNYPLLGNVFFPYNSRTYTIMETMPEIAGELPLPVQDIYTHPVDDGQILLLRLLERGRDDYARNHLLLTEVNSSGERVVGELYFRLLPDKILADSFFVANMPSEEERAHYEGRGIGSLVLERAEQLFKRRYERETVAFETVRDVQGSSPNAGDFFRKNGYTRIEKGDTIGSVHNFMKAL